MNAIKARKLGLGMQILEILGQRNFSLAGCHAHSNGHKEDFEDF